MAGRVEIDTSELRTFEADLRAAPAKVARAARPAVFKGAMNIKNQLLKEMRASRYFRGAASDIDFDVDADGLGAEIGPHTGRGQPGALANIAYFGLANIAYFGTSRGGGTVPDPQGALDAEVPRFEKALSDILGDSI